MLVLSRRSAQSVVIGAPGAQEAMVKVTVLECAGGVVRLGFEAVPEVAVHREEVWSRVCGQREGRNGTSKIATADAALGRWEDDGGRAHHDQAGGNGRVAGRSNGSGRRTTNDASQAANRARAQGTHDLEGLRAGSELQTRSTPATGERPCDPVWFALADSGHCRLLSCRVTGPRAPHVHEYESLENSGPEQEHARPKSQGGATHHVEERERRFAGEIAEWLGRRAEEHNIANLMIYAPARMLGALRKVRHRYMNSSVEARQGDLMRLSAGELALHPIIRSLVRDGGSGA